VKLPSIEKVHAAILTPIERPSGPRRTYQRLAIPFTFKPELSVGEAIVASLAAFLRIFLGSALFSIYGWNALVMWNTIRSPFWKVAVVPPMILLFLLMFTLLMAAISAVVRKILPR